MINKLKEIVNIGKRFVLLFSPLIIIMILLFIIPLIVLFFFSLFNGGSFSTSYLVLLSKGFTYKLIFHSILISFFATVFSLFFSVPIAFSIFVLKKKSNKLVIICLILMPLIINSLIRTLALKAFLSLSFFHFIGSDIAMVIGLMYLYIPLAIIPIYNSLESINKNYVYASYDLGANKFQTFWKIIFPLSIPGIFTASILIFLPSLTTAIVPIFLGNGNELLVGNYIVKLLSGDVNSISSICALSCIILLVFIVILLVFKFFKATYLLKFFISSKKKK